MGDAIGCERCAFGRYFPSLKSHFLTHFRHLLSSLLLLLFVLSFSTSFAFSFAVIGDKQYGDNIHKLLLNKINSDPEISFIVNTGDFALTGQQKDYDNYLKIIKTSNVPVYQVIGNHDAVYGGWKIFKKVFGPSYYSFNHENSHFVVLDNAFKNSFDKRQFDWLVGDLKANKQKHTFIFFHKPTFDATNTYPDHTMDSRYWIEKMMATFKKYNVDYVFSGHIHGYGKAERNGIIYIITGGGGAHLHLPNYLGGFYHYVKITVDEDTISDKVVRLDD